MPHLLALGHIFVLSLLSKPETIIPRNAIHTSMITHDSSWLDAVKLGFSMGQTWVISIENIMSMNATCNLQVELNMFTQNNQTKFKRYWFTIKYIPLDAGCEFIWKFCIAIFCSFIMMPKLENDFTCRNCLTSWNLCSKLFKMWSILLCDTFKFAPCLDESIDGLMLLLIKLFSFFIETL